jgi:periplasmic protein TonB
MALRCLLFSADEGAAEPIRQVLADLGVEGEHCSAAVDAVEKVTQQPFQIVIIDWDSQPEATLLLKTTRERKPAERPLTLAIVSEDASGPQALQAGANSILRKPIQINQVKDTLTTARQLLRAKETAAAAAAAAASTTLPASSSMSSSMPSTMSPGNEKTLRAGEFLQSSPTSPGGQFVTETESFDQPPSEIDALKELEPMAAAVAEEKPAAAPAAPEPDEPRGLQWYLNKRGVTAPRAPVQPSAPLAPPPPPVANAKPDLLGFDQMAAAPATAPDTQEKFSSLSDSAADRPVIRAKDEAQLSAHSTDVVGEGEEAEEAKPKSRPSFQLGSQLVKRTMVAALALAACAVVAAPQAPWHSKVKVLWARGQHTVHAWLNPQPVTTAQAPTAHEDFGRAGDEYKLPVAENIPDATTDPSQIKVTPVVDPTAKKANDGSSANADPNAAQQDAQPDAAAASPGQPGQISVTPAQDSPGSSAGSPAASGQPVAVNPQASAAPSTGSVPAPASATAVPHVEAPAASSDNRPQPASQKPAQVHTVSATATPAIPSSLSTQIASMTPEASGNKAPETALPSIEPVSVLEAAERSLLVDGPAIAYPDTAKGQQGTVVLQVLIGRDGAVQDAKFLQGSLAFARAAIEGVKLWKFKPYVMNGRPVSVQTPMTLSFAPGS